MIAEPGESDLDEFDEDDAEDADEPSLAQIAEDEKIARWVEDHPDEVLGRRIDMSLGRMGKLLRLNAPRVILENEKKILVRIMTMAKESESEFIRKRLPEWARKASESLDAVRKAKPTWNW